MFEHELLNSLATGVVSGVVATLLVFAFRGIWEKIVMPWYEELRYQDAEIKGVWLSEITFPEGEKNKHRMQLNRVGHTVSGTTVCYEGYSEGNSYAFRGTFKNLTLTCTYHINDRRRLERGSMVLMLVKDGTMLNGYLSFYDDRQNAIRSTACEWIAEGRESGPSR